MKRMRPISVLPTMFTLGNLVCGFFSIVIASRIEAPSSADRPTAAVIDRQGPVGIPHFEPTDPMHNILFAVCLIFAAMLFDAMDGSLARLANANSEFGAQLDSLADLVTFGVAPAFLLVKMCPRFAYLHREVVWIIAASFAVCAALRLARFNAETPDDDDHLSFSGLPSPAAAASIAGFAWMFYTLRRENSTMSYAAEIDFIMQNVLPLFAAVVALLMVSRIPYPHLTNRLLRGSRGMGHIVGLVFALAAVMILPGFVVPLICCGFVFSGPVLWVWQEYVQRKPHEEPFF